MNENHNTILIIFTLLIAFILTLLPMPDWTTWLRPAWVLMAITYWVMVAPAFVGVGTAWTVGILLDVLEGTLLGEHALALTIIAFLVIKLSTRLRMYPALQQGFSICIFVFIYQFILYCVQGFIGALPRSSLYWLSPVTSMLFWPWVFVILQDCERKFSTAS